MFHVDNSQIAVGLLITRVEVDDRFECFFRFDESVLAQPDASHVVIGLIEIWFCPDRAGQVFLRIGNVAQREECASCLGMREGIVGITLKKIFVVFDA